jgi:hypothetical protein
MDTQSRPQQIPEACWLSDVIEVRASTIEGAGLFALRPIVADEMVMILGGELINDEQLASLTPPYSSLCVGEGVHILIDPAHPVRYGNHSCDPNMWHRDATTVVTRRAIAAGEELTIDYATHTLSPGWRMACRCGRPLCRGVITGNDWRRAGLQLAYGRHWTPPLLKAIDETKRDEAAE